MAISDIMTHTDMFLGNEKFTYFKDSLWFHNFQTDACGTCFGSRSCHVKHIHLGETSKFPFCDHKQTTKDDKRRWLSLCDPDLSVGSSRGYVRGHICWLGLKYVTSQRTFCGLYVVCMREFWRLPLSWAVFSLIKPEYYYEVFLHVHLLKM